MRDNLYFLIDMNKRDPRLVTKEAVNSFRARYHYETCKVKKGANDKYIQNSANSQAAMWKIIKNIDPNLHSPNTDSMQTP